MKVTFTQSIGHVATAFIMSSRIITENLIRDLRIEATFSSTILTSLYKAMVEIRDNINTDSTIQQLFKGNTGVWNTEARIFLSTTTIENLEALRTSIKGEYLLYSCAVGIFDLYVIQYLLVRGVKVIIGGGYALTNTPQEIRDYFRKMGTPENILENLIIVSGYVDLSTDLYSIIKEWKDYNITKNDFKSMWECQRDYIQPYANIAEYLYSTKLKSTSILRKADPNIWTNSYTLFLFDTRCWWNKCQFCIYPKDKRFDLLNGTDENKVVDNILSTLKLYGSETILFADRYFIFTDKIRRILEQLIKNNIKIGIYTGIVKLLDSQYLVDINRYIKAIFLGLETTSNYALAAIQKGYTKDHIIQAFANLKKSKKDLTIISNIILDLPYKDFTDLRNHYDTLLYLREQLKDRDMRYNGKLLVVPNIIKDQLIDNKRLVKCDFKDPEACGRTIIWKWLANKYNFPTDYFDIFMTSFKRFDDNGILLPSDLEVIDNFQNEIRL